MILSKVYEDAEHRLERNEITLGEFERLVDIEVIEPKRGEWKTELLNPLNAILRCSRCGRYSVDRYNFCPDCGADMRERKESE